MTYRFRGRYFDYAGDVGAFLDYTSFPITYRARSPRVMRAAVWRHREAAILWRHHCRARASLARSPDTWPSSVPQRGLPSARMLLSLGFSRLLQAGMAEMTPSPPLSAARHVTAAVLVRLRAPVICAYFADKVINCIRCRL